MGISHSFSRLSVFDQCALRYDRQYVTADVKDTGGTASNYGNRVHSDFEHYLRDGAPLPDDVAKFKSVLDKVKAVPGEQHYELQMAVRADKTPCDWFARDAWMRGIADLAIINGDTAYAADWKTGKPKDDTQQMQLMAAFIFTLYPQVQTVTAMYVWLFHPHVASPPLVFQREQAPQLWAHFERKVQRVEDAIVQGVFQPKPSGLCPWCPAYDTCNYARRRR